MKSNVGSIDRILRLIAGLGILMPILTATFRFCPAYLPFGLNTCETKPEPKA